MGLLDSYGSSKATGKDFLSNPFSKKIKPLPYQPDFKEGMEIWEYIDGKPGEQDSNRIKLIGNMLPLQPFEYGGKQRIVKDYYPGNSEPVVHILGPEEDSISIRGKLREKRYNDSKFKGVVYEIQKQIEAMRLRGNMVSIVLGEWKRYGFIEEVKFSMKTLGDIDYQISFSIIGFNKPINYQKIKESKDVPIEINQALIIAAEDFQFNASNIPDSIPIGIADILNDAINIFAGALNAVTGYVEAVVSTAENVANTINKAIGLVRYAQIQAYKFKERIGRISIQRDLGPYITGTAIAKKPREYTASSYVNNLMGSTNDIGIYLALLLTQLRALIATLPLARYRTINGDTLQKISIKFYNDVNQWEKIYDHNKLTSTELNPGTFLEIPRI
jgi:hypothetical protein